MLRVDVVGVFLRTTGCTEPGRTLCLTYVEYALTSMFFAGTYLSVARHSPTTADGLSVQMHSVLCLIIESFLMVCIPMRLYHRSHFRDMDRYAKTAGIPDGYRSTIRTIAAYHLATSNLFVVGSALYAVSFDSARAGDPFTFPFIDVLPRTTTTTNLPVYLCKYVVYALPVYIAHFELCFLNTTFVYSAGVVKRHIEIIAVQLETAIIDGDEQKLKNAIRHHQEILKYFKNMKIVYAKPILLTISYYAIHFSLTISLIIEAIQGNIHQIIMGISITSGMAAQITTVVYCIYASKMSNLHDDILFIFFDHRLQSLDKSFKKISLIMMTRINEPLEFTVCYIFKINLNLFVKIMKYSYTVLNVMLNSLRHRISTT